MKKQIAPSETKPIRLKTHLKAFFNFLNNGINWAILSGMIGLFVGVFIFTTGNSIYGELMLVKRPLIDQLLQNRIIRLNNMLKTPDTSFLPKQYKANYNYKIKQAIIAAKREQQLFDNGNADTSLHYINNYVLVKRSEYAMQIDRGKWINDKNNGSYRAVSAQLMDSCKLCNSSSIYPVTIKLIKNKRQNAIDFFKDYPQFGSWLVFAMIQMVLWFMIVPFLAGLVIKLNRKLDSVDKIKFTDVLLNMVLPILFVGLFCYLFYVDLLNDWLIKNDYFLSDFQVRMAGYCSIGYMIACACFGTHTTLVRKLSSICETLKERPNDPQSKEMYFTAKSSFDNSFLCSALILSFCVLWTGIMVNAVNGIEAFRFYFILSGKDFIPNDFVYLQGLLHTLILLIFYIPAKFKFNSLTTNYFGIRLTKSETIKPKTIFTALSDSLGPILITVSPLLASVVHSLLNIVVKN